jgi:HEPN domain-containing protein
VCFHAQQCAEKYFKATLVDAGIEFEKTHDLGILLDMLVRLEPSWEKLRKDMDSLAGLAVEVRYPGYCAEAEDADVALEIASQVRQVVRQRLGLPQ